MPTPESNTRFRPTDALDPVSLLLTGLAALLMNAASRPTADHPVLQVHRPDDRDIRSRKAADIAAQAAKHARDANRSKNVAKLQGWVLAAPAVVLGGLAGVGAVSDQFGDRTTTWLTISAAVFSLMVAALKPHERADAARTRWANWSKLGDDAEDYLDLDLPTLSDEAARQQLSCLRDRHYQLRKARGVMNPST